MKDYDININSLKTLPELMKRKTEYKFQLQQAIYSIDQLNKAKRKSTYYKKMTIKAHQEDIVILQHRLEKISKRINNYTNEQQQQLQQTEI